MWELHFAGMRTRELACARGESQLPVRRLIKRWNLTGTPMRKPGPSELDE